METTSKRVRRFLLRHVLPPVGTLGIRILGLTWRYRPLRRHLHEELLAGERPIVAAFLHARTLPLLHFMSRPGNGRWIIMCSKSRDGEFMARVERRLGYVVVRGSSGSGGSRALVEMIKLVRRNPGLQSCLGIDGSRGPRGVAQPGIITLVQKTNAVLLPIAASASRCKVWHKSWDRMILPRPFAAIHVVFGEPIEVPAELGADEAEAMRRTIERTVLDLHEEADALAGFEDTEPLQLAAAALD